MATPRIHYYIDGDLAACGKKYDGEDNFSDNLDEVTCKKCENRANTYEDDLDDTEDDDTETEVLAPSAVAEPIVIDAQYKIIFTLAPNTLDKGNTKEVESTLYYKGDKQIEIRKVCIRENEYDNQIKVYTKPIPYHVFSEEKRVEKYVESYGLLIMPNQNTDEGGRTMAAPRKSPAVAPVTHPVIAPKALTLQEKIDAQKAAAAAQSSPPAVTIRTPHTPPARPPVSEKEAETKEPTLARLCKLETTVENIRHNFESHKPISRINALEAEVLKDKEIIAAQSTLIQELVTRLEDCEQAIIDYCVTHATVTAPDLAGIDPGNIDVFDCYAMPETVTDTAVIGPVSAILTYEDGTTETEPMMLTVRGVGKPRPPVAPAAPRRPIPAKGTGKLAEFSDEQCVDMVERYQDHGEKMSAIAMAYHIADPSDKGSKLVWHLIKRGKALLS